MQENWLSLANAFTPTNNYVLATIIETRGSTYQKVGTMMLVDQQGECTGLLSGGCLEADISLHAVELLQSNKTKILTYDLSVDNDLLWGLGLGCDGAIDILLQPLLVGNNHLGFNDVVNAILSGNSGVYCLGIGDDVEPQSLFHLTEHSLSSQEITQLIAPSFNGVSFLSIPVFPPLSVVICGAGQDVLPVVTIFNELGWNIHLWDHRAGYIEQSAFACVKNTKVTRPTHIQTQDFTNVDAMVLMTHNLSFDEQYLALARQANLPYIGILGPQGRKNKLLKQLNINNEAVEGQVFGPIGLDLGGRGPQAIALSIAAQIQQHFSLRNSDKRIKPWRVDH